MIAEAIQRGKSYIKVFASRIAYIETGNGDPIVLLHGNPASSYLWRNIIPILENAACCTAPDLVGMGDSEKLPHSGPMSYTLAEHRRYLDELLTGLEIQRDLVFVAHGWGAALAFDWARRHPNSVRGVAHMEGVVQPLNWEHWPSDTREFLEQLRSPAGEHMALEENQVVEWILPRGTIRDLTAAEMEAYRRPFHESGEARRPTLAWVRQLPIEGEPPDVVETVDSNSRWLAASPIPKLFINADPGTLPAEARDRCRGWPNTTEVTVRGLHFLPEDSPEEIGGAIANWYRSLR